MAAWQAWQAAKGSLSRKLTQALLSINHAPVSSMSPSRSNINACGFILLLLLIHRHLVICLQRNKYTRTGQQFGRCAATAGWHLTDQPCYPTNETLLWCFSNIVIASNRWFVHCCRPSSVQMPWTGGATAACTVLAAAAAAVVAQGCKGLLLSVLLADNKSRNCGRTEQPLVIIQCLQGQPEHT